MNHRLYKKALDQGCSPKLAEMLACHSPPGCVTDEIPGLAAADPFDGVPESMREYYIRRAEEAGINPAGKKYIGSLADSPGDPKALVESKADMRRLVKQYGMGCSDLKVPAAPVDEDFNPVGEPADDIVEETAMSMLQEDGCQGTCTVKEWESAKDKARTTLKGG